ncbi:MAG: hypothetical protein WBB01_24625 [Phormidesmis sp.]
MPRLSDRAFHLLKNEIEYRYQVGLENSIERIVLLARLETLRAREGKPMSQIELWQEVGDIAPDFNSAVLEQASAGTRFPVLSASVSVGAIAALSAVTLGIDARQADVSTSFASTTLVQRQSATPPTHHQLAANLLQPSDSAALAWAKSDTSSAFETAKRLGWQAALKGQNPPHSQQHWSEAAALWRQAIAQLDQIAYLSADYAAAQEKKTLYQQNLQQVEMRQIAAQQPAPSAVLAPQFSSQRADWLTIAKRYGWQAALASQNAPHPAQQWAEIAEVWEIALSTLGRIEPAHPQYAEAQQVKARYQQNLSAIRHRYQLEQTTAQQLQALQHAIIQLDRTTSNAARESHLRGIIQQLKTIPAGTQAHAVAQQLISQLSVQTNLMAAHPQ